MIRSFAILVGLAILIFGIIGFSPIFALQGKVFNIFRVNFEHNVLHVVTGLLAILSGLNSAFASKMFFIISGAVFALLAGVGFVQGDEMIFEMFAVNTEDHVLHGAIAAVFLLFGFTDSTIHKQPQESIFGKEKAWRLSDRK